MKDFLKEYWLWILIPGLFVLAGIVALVLASRGDGSSPFDYPIF